MFFQALSRAARDHSDWQDWTTHPYLRFLGSENKTILELVLQVSGE
jgi:hypothetical protein